MERRCRSDADGCVAQSTRAIRDADGVVLPGVGAFHDAAERLERGGLGAAVLERIAAGTPFLGICFVHSCAAVPADPSVIAATTDDGGPVVATVARDNVWAVQFHPERSSRVGPALLAGFVAGVLKEARPA